MKKPVNRWPSLIIITIYILFTPICIYFAKKNQTTQLVLYTGWTPVLIAMSISSLGGREFKRVVKSQ